MQKFDLNGQSAIVTAASKDIGEINSQSLAELWCKGHLVLAPRSWLTGRWQ